MDRTTQSSLKRVGARERAGGHRATVCVMTLGAAFALSGGCENRQLAAKRGTQQPDSLLTFFAQPSPAEMVGWAVDPYDADKRFRGTLLLANAPFGGEPIYLELYQRALTDGDSSVRAAAVRGLSLHGSPQHVSLITPLLSDPDRLLRWEAARALQRLHHPDAIAPLVGRLFERNEPEAKVRSSVACALGQYADARVLEALFAALGDRDLTVNRAAVDSLRTLTGQDFGLNMRAWVAWNRSTREPFAGRTAYVFPVFYRDKTWVETILPFWEPPNEIQASPVGLGGLSNRPDRGTSATTGNAADGSVRKN